MVTKCVAVTQVVKVTVDEKKFDEKFMKEFRESFYNFTTIDDHIKHLAQLYVRGCEGFIEGYGEQRDMGISFEIVEQDEEFE